MYKLVIFDLDGTLLDSARIIKKIINKIRRHEKKDSLPIQFYKERISIGVDKLISDSLDIKKSSLDSKKEYFRRQYFKYTTTKHDFYPTSISTLHYLKKKGFATAIASNKPIFLCKKILSDIKILNLFDLVVGDDNQTPLKPDPQQIFSIMRKLKIKNKDTLFIGDSQIDYKTSRNARIDFIFFNKGYGMLEKDCKTLGKINTLEKLKIYL